MTPAELQAKLAEFLSLPTETEWGEFKEATEVKQSDDQPPWAKSGLEVVQRTEEDRMLAFL